MSGLRADNSAVFVQGADTEAFTLDQGVVGSPLFAVRQIVFCSTLASSTMESFFCNKVLPSGNHYYRDASQPGPCLFPGENVVPISVTVGYQNDADLHGVIMIRAAAGCTPEPGSCPLLLTGAGLVASKRKLVAPHTTGP